MPAALGDVLGSAVGAAVSPLPIVALLLVLTSGRPVPGGVAFAVGWFAGLGVLFGLVLALDPAGGPTGDGPHAVLLLVRLVVGLLFLVMAYRQWRGRPRPGEEPTPPAWMASLGSLPPPRIAFTAAVLAVANPKNLGLTVSAATDVSARGLGTAEGLVVAGVFALLASLTVLGPVLATVVARDRARPALDELSGWLARHGWAVMVLLFTVLGSRILGSALVVA